MMSARDFRIGWRLLAQQPAYSAAALGGLATGFALCLLLLCLVRYSFSFDAAVPQAERVYVLKHRLNFIPQPQWLEYTPFALRDVALRSGFPLQASVFWPRKATFEQDGRQQELEITAVDPAFAAIFQPRVLAGDLSAALSRPDGLAVTESMARRLFGHADVPERVLGRDIALDRQRLRVRAVLADPPLASTVSYALLAGTGSVLWPAPQRDAALANWMGIAGKIYVKTGAGVSAEALRGALQTATDQGPWNSLVPPQQRAALGERKPVEIALGPLRDAYFDTTVANTIGSGPRADRRLVLGLGAIGLLILLLAVSNYISLAAVRTLQRQREIAVRRVLGASSGQLLAQFLADSLLLSLGATALGVLLAWLLLPLFAALVARPLDDIFAPLPLVLCVLAGTAAGAYPGWLACRVDMRQALAQRSGDTRGSAGLRRVLTVSQLALAMGLGSVALAVAWQTRYASEAGRGFDAAPLLVLELPKGQDMRQPASVAFRDAVLRLPGVAAVADSRDVPGRDGGGGTRSSDIVQRGDGGSISLEIREVSASFFDAYGVAALAGRAFDPAIERAPGASAIVINMAAVRALGMATAQQAPGRWLNGQALQIVGVVPDIRWQSLREPLLPVMYRLDPANAMLTVRLAAGADGASVTEAIAPLWQRYFTGQVYAPKPLTAYAASAYADDRRMASLLAWASAAIFVLAAFGVYVQRRAREVVLRKLHGAGRLAIGTLVVREFLWLLAIAGVAALPPAALAIARYLAAFSAHPPIGAWPLALALLAAAFVVALATARHAWLAIRMAPVQALRD
ncbi:ABC transporter permease [Janthinobacterium sp. SUN100]|uniref:ABC transporter permease n=1 Tax=Janthinobacterium sp. SUN100 TaxID=3004101 RepID=UPI0025AFC4E6|nr:ABC transporter permease [Janthinobacterium sp. SUN100]MDN2704502.1 ABC transporter permease [Janthinobacterium sp. SUN100]